MGSSPPDFLPETKQSLEPFKRHPDNTGMSRAKYLHLLEDPEVKRWHQNVARGSRITADVYLRRLMQKEIEEEIHVSKKEKKS
jgi:hypothetical protein